jgi:hypothetical protein
MTKTRQGKELTVNMYEQGREIIGLSDFCQMMNSTFEIESSTPLIMNAIKADQNLLLALGSISSRPSLDEAAREEARDLLVLRYATQNNFDVAVCDEAFSEIERSID